MSYGPLVILVTLVLLGFVLASLAGCLFAPLLMKGEGKEMERMRDLAESGIEVESRLISLVPFGNRGYAHALYEFNTSYGATRHDTAASVGHAMVVGNAYPLVYHPDNLKLVQMGTMATVRREVRFRRGGVRGAKRILFASLAALVLAVVGLILIPPGPLV